MAFERGAHDVQTSRRCGNDAHTGDVRSAFVNDAAAACVQHLDPDARERPAGLIPDVCEEPSVLRGERGRQCEKHCEEQDEAHRLGASHLVPWTLDDRLGRVPGEWCRERQNRYWAPASVRCRTEIRSESLLMTGDEGNAQGAP